MPDIYTVKTEFGVHGYHYRFIDYKGTIEEIKAAIKKAGFDFSRKLTLADERDGDLRQFCPSFANGYPNLAGFEAEWGEDFDITILSVVGTKTVVTETEFDYHTVAHAAFRKAAGE